MRGFQKELLVFAKEIIADTVEALIIARQLQPEQREEAFKAANSLVIKDINDTISLIREEDQGKLHEVVVP